MDDVEVYYAQNYVCGAQIVTFDGSEDVSSVG